MPWLGKLDPAGHCKFVKPSYVLSVRVGFSNINAISAIIKFEFHIKRMLMCQLRDLQMLVTVLER